MTFYSLIDDLRTFATQHPQLQSFAFGPTEEVDLAKKGQDEYPLLYAVPGSVVIDRGEMQITLDLIVAQPYFDETREEALMQMLQIMGDVISFATQSTNQTNGLPYSILSEPPFSCEPFLVRFDNALIGWGCSMVFGSDHVNNFCLAL